MADALEKQYLSVFPTPGPNTDIADITAFCNENVEDNLVDVTINEDEVKKVIEHMPENSRQM